MKYTEKVRQLADPYWAGSFVHPFITELQAGSLSEEVFRYYLLQDRYYLEHFGKLYEQIAATCDDPEVKVLMQDSGENLKAGEISIRQTFFAELAITEAEIASTPIAPTAYNYVSHMYRQLVAGSTSAAVAGMLPCAWLYTEIGLKLIEQGSPNPLYQRWIETYAGPEAMAHIDYQRQLLDRLYEAADAKERQQMESAFVISSQMEYLFWEMAYTLEKWPTGRVSEGIL